MATEYQLEKAREQARAAGKVPASDKKKQTKKSLSQKEQSQIDIDKYNARFRAGRKTSDKRRDPLATLKDYSKPSSTATSGGSKAVRKVTAEDSGDTDLVKRLRKKPFQYYFTSPNPNPKVKRNR